MKAITGYLIVICVSVILAAVAATGMTRTHTVKKSPLQVSIDSRKAQLAALDEL